MGRKKRKVVINVKCYGKLSWVRSLVEVWPTQRVYQWEDWITNPSLGEEVSNIDWLIEVLTGTKKSMNVQTQRLSHGHNLSVCLSVGLISETP